jgi:hypothetical protein
MLKHNSSNRGPDGSSSRRLIEFEAIVVAYAMSRLDAKFLQLFEYKSWRQAFADAAARFGVAPASMKNLRDEFDPVHGNARKGWKNRPMRENRQRVLGEFCEMSEPGLVEIVARILRGDREVRELVTKPILAATTRAGNVAERLRTGREAERYFMTHAETICGVSGTGLIDVRDEARGFDFGIAENGNVGIEVKGMRLARGEILFTDYEWSQAKRKASNYWLVVVGCLDADPRALLIRNPAAEIKAHSNIRQSATVSWRARVRVA